MFLTAKLKDKCEDVLDELNDFPISDFFSEPVDPKKHEAPGYFEIIKNPSDLSTVRKKLLSNHYQTLEQFRKDMHLIWDNAIQYNGKNSLPGVMAEDLMRKFEKRFKYIEDSDHWKFEYKKNKSIISRLMRKIPAPLASTNVSLDSSKLEPKRLSIEETKFFFNNRRFLENKETFDNILEYLSKNDFNISVSISNENIMESLSKLSPYIRKSIIDAIENLYLENGEEECHVPENVVKKNKSKNKQTVNNTNTKGNSADDVEEDVNEV